MWIHFINSEISKHLYAGDFVSSLIIILYYFSIKQFNYPIPTRDAGNDIVRQRTDSIAQTVHDLFQGSKNFITKSTLSDLFPNLFNWIHFRGIRRYVE